MRSDGGGRGGGDGGGGSVSSITAEQCLKRMGSMPVASDDHHDSVPCSRRGLVKHKQLDTDALPVLCHCSYVSRPSNCCVALLL